MAGREKSEGGNMQAKCPDPLLSTAYRGSAEGSGIRIHPREEVCVRCCAIVLVATQLELDDVSVGSVAR